ncbi:ABC transporter ATP-binding protein [Nonomuraea sp. KM90]|uniref:ABC transporter ATP-binding protein n=1 Tax=Nonomuraea sp. KM90 TaxID=3457428 RepID=UPI003FCD3747
MISLHGLTKVFPGGVHALDDLHLTIADGEFFALLGPSGCGKTTLLRTIAGLETPTRGQIRIDDTDVTALPPGDRDVAMVFQDYAIFPHMNVTANIAYPLRIKKVPRAERTAKAAGVAARLSLTELLHRRPSELSGGQQQRVALARAIACHPTAFLFDEPLSYPTSTPASASKPGPSSNASSANSPSPPSSSPTTRPRPSPSPIASPSCRTAA